MKIINNFYHKDKMTYITNEVVKFKQIMTKD